VEALSLYKKGNQVYRVTKSGACSNQLLAWSPPQ
jgi:hypothetical protein